MPQDVWSAKDERKYRAILRSCSKNRSQKVCKRIAAATVNRDRSREGRTLGEVSKGQTIRILDVALIGPLMIGGGIAWTDQRPVLGGALTIFGVATILYNARNYVLNERSN